MVMRPTRIQPGPGQESVWDYPRPPAVVATDDHVRIVHGGVVIVDTRSAVRVLETSQPPAYYVPSTDVAMEHLHLTRSRSVCEWKGVAVYWNVDDARDAAWGYPSPVAAYAVLADRLAFYAQRVDECWVNDERVVANPGSFYGGWITSQVVGPFKGDAGTSHW
ncbi:MAG: hypothetical protein JWN99_3212 [Ilumatobacteraceae bacterium]|nr:hypothetical protein [Ilumatobacteraceae bacterium]